MLRAAGIEPGRASNTLVIIMMYVVRKAQVFRNRFLRFLGG